VGGQWTKKEVNIYPCEKAKGGRLYPDPKLLQWKFAKFLLNRDNPLCRITYKVTALFVTTPKKGGK